MDQSILLTVEFSVTLRKVVLSAVAVLTCSVPWYPSFKPQGALDGVIPFALQSVLAGQEFPHSPSLTDNEVAAPLPIHHLGSVAEVAFRAAQQQLFRLDQCGVVTVHNPATGECTAVVDVPRKAGTSFGKWGSLMPHPWGSYVLDPTRAS